MKVAIVGSGPLDNIVAEECVKQNLPIVIMDEVSKVRHTAVMSGMLSMAIRFADSITEMHDHRIQNILDEYAKTKYLPRKRKKKERKRLNEDYSFFMMLKEWDKEMFNFK